MTAFKTLIFTVLFPGTVTVLIPYRLGSSAAATGDLSIGSLRYLGVAIIAMGVVIYLWCAWDFTFAGKGTPAPIDPPKELVVRGLYKFVRNPMYVGVLSVLLGEAVLFQARVLFWYAGIVFVLFFAFVVFYEESALGRKFGTSYQRYRDVVPRWIPRIRNTATKIP